MSLSYKNGSNDRIHRAFKFMKILRVEPYLFLAMLQMNIKTTPNSQLIEDKICRFWYNQTEKYCHDLPAEKDIVKTDLIKSKILADAALFGTYNSYLTTLPALVWAIFIGAWIDRYLKGRKLLMIITAVASICENIIGVYLSINFKTSVYYHLLVNIPSSLVGGHIASKIAVNHYMTSTTPPRMRAIRFMFYEMCIILASPIGSALGGYILVQKPIFHFGEIRNYSLCFIISLILETLALIWILLMINEKKAQKQAKKIITKYNIKCDNNNDSNNNEKCVTNSDKTIHPLKLLFDLRNVKQMIKCCFKKRPNKIRKQIWLLLTVMFVNLMAHTGPNHIATQYDQKVYFWAPDIHSYVKAISMGITSIATITIVPFLIRVVKISDIPLTIIGFCSYSSSMIMRGTILTEQCYYISIFVGCASGVAAIGIRSYISKIIDYSEVGKVFSFITAVDTIAPMISNILYTYTFNSTINTHPGVVLQMTALLMFIPILIVMWIDMFTVRPISEKRVKSIQNNITILTNTKL